MTDDDLQGEIDLVGALVLAAADADGPMSQSTIDEVLGVDGPEQPGEAEAAEPPAEGVVADPGPDDAPR